MDVDFSYAEINTPKLVEIKEPLEETNQEGKSELCLAKVVCAVLASLHGLCLQQCLVLFVKCFQPFSLLGTYLVGLTLPLSLAYSQPPHSL